MPYSLEELQGKAWVLRFHPKGGFGDDYTWVVTVEQIGTTAFLKGTKDAPRKIKELKDFFRSYGFTKVEYIHKGKHVVVLL